MDFFFLMEGTTSDGKKKKKGTWQKFSSKEDSVIIFVKQDAFLPAQGLNYFKVYVLDFISRTSCYLYKLKRVVLTTLHLKCKTMMNLSARV